MVEVLEVEKPADVVKRLLDGRPLTWLAGNAGISYRRLRHLLSDAAPEPGYLEAVAIGKALGVEPESIFGGAK